MKQFFSFDRRKKDDVVDQVVTQFISYVEDYKLINGTILPKLDLVKKDLELTDKELQKIITELTQRGYLTYLIK